MARLYSVNVSLAKKIANKDDYIVPKVTVSLNGNYLTSACIDPNSLTTGLVDFEVAFNDAPDFSASDVLTVSLSTQSGSLSGLATAIVTGDIIRCKINTATAGSVTSIFEANIDGDKSIFFVFNGKLNLTSDFIRHIKCVKYYRAYNSFVFRFRLLYSMSLNVCCFIFSTAFFLVAFILPYPSLYG